MSYSEIKTVKDQWIDNTKNGNELFQKEKFGDALPFYERAVLLGELLLRNVKDAANLRLEIVCAFSVSCINMAQNYLEMQEVGKAGDYFLYNVWNLKLLSCQKDMGEEFYMEVKKNWQKAVLALTTFYKQTGQPLTIDFWKDETYQQIQFSKEWLVLNKTKLN